MKKRFQNIFNPDFQDFIAALNKHEVEYVLVGGYSVVLHGYPRNTGDLDVWTNPTAENFVKLCNAFYEFGLSLFNMTEKRFLDTKKYDVFTFGMPPVSIDIMTAMKGLEFQQVFENAEWFEVEGKLKVRAIRLADLITAKKAANRPKDKDDIQNLLKKNKQ